MRLNGQLEKAQLENVTADPTNLPDGRVFLNTTDDKAKVVINGSAKALALEEQLTAASISNTPSGNLAATDVQAALNEIQTEIDSLAADADLQAHIDDALEAHMASSIGVQSGDGITAGNVQGALVELLGDINTRALATDLTNHINDATDAHDASAISVSGSDYVGTDVQAVLGEVKTLLDSKASGGSLSGHTGATTNVHGTSGQVVGTDNVQTLTNKTLTAPQIDVMSLAEQVSTPATPTAGKVKVYAKDDNKLYYLNDSGIEQQVGSGSGAGGINYIDNPDAETDTTGWITYANVSARTPYTGVGGFPSVTWTRTTSSPLRGNASFLFTKGASNLQGHGASYDFTIDSADKAKVLQISFDYEIASGTYSGGTSSTDSDLIVYLYDVGNSALIEPAPIKLNGGVSGVQYKHTCTFQTASNSTTYRLIIHCSTTSTSAYTVKFDNFQVGPQVQSIGGIATDWQTWTPVISNTTNATAAAHYRRVGSNIEIKGQITWSSAGAGASTVFLTIPSGLTFASLNSDVMGSGFTYDGTFKELNVRATGGSIYFNRQGDGTNFIGSSGTSGMILNFEGSHPITGWGTSMVLSSETDTRVAVASLTGGGTTGTSGGDQKITGMTVESDTHGHWDSTNSRLYVKAPGYYVLNATGAFSPHASGAASSVIIKVYKNGVSQFEVARRDVITGEVTVVSNWLSGVSTPKWYNAGDCIEFYSFQNSGQTRAFTGISFGLRRESGPAQIAASETVACRYTNVTGAAVANVDGTVLDFATKDYDTHGAVTTGASWRFTAPCSGLFEVNVNVLSIGTQIKAMVGRLRVGGTNKKSSVIGREVATSSYIPVNLNGKFRLLAGEYIDFVHYETTDGDTLSSAAGDCSIEIMRVGNY